MSGYEILAIVVLCVYILLLGYMVYNLIKENWEYTKHQGHKVWTFVIHCVIFFILFVIVTAVVVFPITWALKTLGIGG